MDVMSTIGIVFCSITAIFMVLALVGLSAMKRATQPPKVRRYPED